MFNSQGHIMTSNLQVEEPVHTSWERLCTVNHRASGSNYQLSNMKCPGRDSNRQPQRLKANTLTATPSSPLFLSYNTQVPSSLTFVFLKLFLFFFISTKQPTQRHSLPVKALPVFLEQIPDFSSPHGHVGCGPGVHGL